MDPPTPPEANLDLLPTEVVYQILLKADLVAIANFCLTSTKAASYCRDDSFWQAKYWQDFGRKSLPEGKSWKILYQEQVTNKVRNSPVAAGVDHYGVIDDQGQLYMAGRNGSGQLGIGSIQSSKRPIKVTFPSRIISISCSNGTTGAITEDGLVYIWGMLPYTRIPARIPTPFDIFDNLITLEVKRTWQGDEFLSVKAPGPRKPLLPIHGKPHKIVHNLKNIAVIFKHGSIYLRTHTPYRSVGGPIIGGHTVGIIASLPNQVKVIDVAIAGDKIYVVSRDGTLYQVGVNDKGLIDFKEVVFPEKVKQIATGFYHLVVLSRNGNVYTQGLDPRGSIDHGQLGRMTITTPAEMLFKVTLPDSVSSISAGGNTTAAITHDGRLYMWGSNQHQNIISLELAKGLAKKLPKVVQIYTPGICLPGKCEMEIDILSPIEISVGGRVKDVTVGSTFTIAITQEGEVNYWGDPDYAPT